MIEITEEGVVYCGSAKIMCNCFLSIFACKECPLDKLLTSLAKS